MGIMADRLALFMDRRHAGRVLGEVLDRFREEAPIVLALPRGGVPVGFEVAKALDAPLDITLVRKLGAPFNPEYGIGAIAEDSVCIVRWNDIELIGLSDPDLEKIINREEAELERRQRLYRGEREPLPVVDRTAIVVDDGLATGATAIAAGRALKLRGAAKVILAVPVAPAGTSERLAGAFDEIVALDEPEGFFGVGQFYVDFGEVSDQEVVELLEASRSPEATGGSDPADPPVAERAVQIEPAPGARLTGDLRLPAPAAGLVVFAHGSGSSRLSPRNRQVAETLNEAGFATLLFDLLTSREEVDRANVFDVRLLAERLLAVARWIEEEPDVAGLPLGLFGASTGAAAALSAAATLGSRVGAVVSRGGRPDLAADSLDEVVSPTLLIVGGADWQVLELNERAARLLRCEREVAVVPGATHLFEEPGALERVAALAADWFGRHLVERDAEPTP